MTHKHLSDSEFRVLVFAEEDSDDYRTAAAHVEQCTRCQNRLSSLTGFREQLLEVGQLLRGYDTDTRSSELAAESATISR